MITRELSLNLMPSYSFEEEYDINKIVFFDIETTGLSAQNTYLYLIGCAYFRDGSFHLIQWFSEGIDEEELLIRSFFDFLKGFRLLIHFNGSGFDIPFIEEKIRLLGLGCSFGSIESLDIYRLIKPYKSIMKIKNLRLKSLENYFRIRRKDTLDGEELIGVYAAYIGKKRYESLRQSRIPEFAPETPESALLLEQLLQHNEDDIRGLMQISSILNYVAMFEKPIRILNAKAEDNRLIIDFEISARLPVPVSFGDDMANVSASGSSATLAVLIYEGELKHFYENYRDYYYLPAEDCAVHKSVAAFVDKEYRIKAKPGNCYTRKQGLFAPQYDKWLSPYFMQNYQDKLTFVEIHTDSLLQEEKLELYVRHMLRHMLVSAQRVN
ncbi:MAG: ribonuclease H-like domain-containing protein [Clostridiales bacterium]|nr:ribonuclease H-like domain-containing protein [Clostridiales bacterium]